MKQALILHGTGATPDSNWFSWLKTQLEALDYGVWAPILPEAHQPNSRRYTDFLLNSDWNFQDSLIIGHSSGAVEILHLLQNLPEKTTVKTAVLVSVFSAVLADDPDWAQLSGLFEEPFDMNLIRSKVDTMLVVHGSDDPWCDPNDSKHIAHELAAEYVEIPGGQHFSTSLDPAYTEFPRLIAILQERDLL